MRGCGLSESKKTKMKQNKTKVTREKDNTTSAQRTQVRATYGKSTMAGEPARARLLWAILSLVLPVTFGHATVYRSPALTFSAEIKFAKKRPASCSAVMRHSASSWTAVVHWSALMPKALRSSRKHTIPYFSWSPTQPHPPPILRTLRSSAVSYPPCAPQTPRTRFAF